MFLIIRQIDIFTQTEIFNIFIFLRHFKHNTKAWQQLDSTATQAIYINQNITVWINCIFNLSICNRKNTICKGFNISCNHNIITIICKATAFTDIWCILKSHFMPVFANISVIINRSAIKCRCKAFKITEREWIYHFVIFINIWSNKSGRFIKYHWTIIKSDIKLIFTWFYGGFTVRIYICTQLTLT